MADSRLLRVGDWALDVAVPNKALAAWLNGPEAEAQLKRVADEIYRAYKNSLPRRTGNLKRGAYRKVERRKLPRQTERYYAWIGNEALSYRKKEGQPYPRAIEYGRKTKSGGRTKAGYQLRLAAAEVARRRGLDDAATAMLGGMSGAGTAHHQARPAQLSEEQLARMREMASGGNTRRRPMTLQEKAAERARREQIARQRAARSRANMNEYGAQNPRPPRKPQPPKK
jgi:hypothetical protein